MAKGKYQKKRRFRGAYLWVLALILLGTAVWGVSAKYAQQREQELLVQAELFYFTSDRLMENGEDYTMNPDTTSIRFSLNNFADSRRSSECDIQYTVYINEEQYGETGLLQPILNPSDEITFPVQPGNTYVVRVEGDAGYTKTLSATFTVLAEPAGFYKHLDTSSPSFVLLTVWTQNLAGDVTVAFPADLIPDGTDSALATVNNYNLQTKEYSGATTPAVYFSEYSSRTYRFFRDDPTIAYNIEQFTVTMGSAEAKPGTP